MKAVDPSAGYSKLVRKTGSGVGNPEAGKNWGKAKTGVPMARVVKKLKPLGPGLQWGTFFRRGTPPQIFRTGSNPYKISPYATVFASPYTNTTISPYATASVNKIQNNINPYRVPQKLEEPLYQELNSLTPYVVMTNPYEVMNNAFPVNLKTQK